MPFPTSATAALTWIPLIFLTRYSHDVGVCVTVVVCLSSVIRRQSVRPLRPPYIVAKR